VNAPGRAAYPISSFTWVLMYHKPRDVAKNAELVKFLKWAYANGADAASSLDYAPLPAAMRTALTRRLDRLSAAPK